MINKENISPNKNVKKTKDNASKPKKEKSKSNGKYEYLENIENFRENPTIMNETIFSTISEYSMNLLPKNRNVALCFEHFQTKTICESMKEYNENVKKLPEHCLVLNLRFLSFNCCLFIGNICYYKTSNRANVAQALKRFISDLFLCGLRVTCTISSARFDVLIVLKELNLTKMNGYYFYRVDNHMPIIHLFDPSWLIRKLRSDYDRYNISYRFGQTDRVASSADLQLFASVPLINNIYSAPDYKSGAIGTSSAIKLFSHSVCQGLREVAEICGHDKVHDGTALLSSIFDKLIDTFNTSPELGWQNDKQLRHLVTTRSSHWAIWTNTPVVLRTMTFIKNAKRLPTTTAKPKTRNAQKAATGKRPKLTQNAYRETDYEYALKTKQEKDKPNYEELQNFVQNIGNHLKNAENIENISESLKTIEKKCKEFMFAGCSFEVIQCMLTRQLKQLKNTNRDEQKEIFDKVFKDLSFFDQNIFKFWLYSIAAIETLCRRQLHHHMDRVNTSLFNCDPIHDFVSRLQRVEKIYYENLVKPFGMNYYMKPSISILAFGPQGNVVVPAEKSFHTFPKS